ncbi:HTD2 family dehydratase [Terrabacter terrigena]|uniref:Mesaconyl-C4 CoA hydratase n=1 Tax=Terrabacter terrigena TaxID=574718 RepID=A0ABW3N2I7_9MICO
MPHASRPAAADTQSRTELIAHEPVEALAGLLDVGLPDPRGWVPPLWHWLYLLDRRPQGHLGPDGHPSSGIPAPPGPGLRRMFAGGRIQTYRLLEIGRPATRTVRVAKTSTRQGRSGPLTFVTVRHEISQDEETAIIEEQDIVYRAADTGSLPTGPGAQVAPLAGEPKLSLAVTESLLFRFSALTYNAHRIHYDHRWAQREGYEDLVVHGPLQALMMGELLRRNGVQQVGREFAFRLVAPLVGPQTIVATAGEQGLGAGAQIRDVSGRVTAASTLGPLVAPSSLGEGLPAVGLPPSVSGVADDSVGGLPRTATAALWPWATGREGDS